MRFALLETKLGIVKALRLVEIRQCEKTEVSRINFTVSYVMSIESLDSSSTGSNNNSIAKKWYFDSCCTTLWINEKSNVFIAPSYYYQVRHQAHATDVTCVDLSIHYRIAHGWVTRNTERVKERECQQVSREERNILCAYMPNESFINITHKQKILSDKKHADSA